MFNLKKQRNSGMEVNILTLSNYCIDVFFNILYLSLEFVVKLMIISPLFNCKHERHDNSRVPLIVALNIHVHSRS